MVRRALVARHTKHEQLEQLFGTSAPLAAEVLDTIDSDRTRRWQPDDIVAATGASLVDVMMIVARLTTAELVEHDGLGSGYRSK